MCERYCLPPFLYSSLLRNSMLLFNLIVGAVKVGLKGILGIPEICSAISRVGKLFVMQK